MIVRIIPRGKPSIPTKKASVQTNKEYDMVSHSGKEHKVHGQQQAPQTKEDNQEQPHTRVPGHAITIPMTKALNMNCITPQTRAIIVERIKKITDKKISGQAKQNARGDSIADAQARGLVNI